MFTDVLLQSYLYDKENVTKALLGNHKVWVDLFELSQSFSDSSVALNFLEVLKNIPRESRTFENFWIPLNKIIECTPQIDLTTTILEEDSRQWLGILMPHGYGIFFNDGLTSHLIYSLTCPIDMRPSSIKETAPVNLKSDEAEKGIIFGIHFLFDECFFSVLLFTGKIPTRKQRK